MREKGPLPTARHNALFACCHQTVPIYRGETQEGGVLRCLWCRHELVFQGGAWEPKKEDEKE